MRSRREVVTGSRAVIATGSAMFGWRRKNEGFVWNEYVRTEVLQRRKRRRQQIDDMRVAAIEGAKEAGRKGLAVSVAGGRSAASGLWYGLKAGTVAVYDFLSVASVATFLLAADRLGQAFRLSGALLGAGFGLLYRGFGSAGTAAGQVATITLAPVTTVLRQPTAVLLLGLTAAISAISAAGRFHAYGFDAPAAMAAGAMFVSLVGLALGRAPEIATAARAAAERTGLDGAASRAWTGLARMAGSGEGRTSAAASAVTLGVTLTVGIGVVTWLASVFGSAGTPDAVASGKSGFIATGGRIEGKATVMSPVKLKVNGTEVVLYGVEAPEATQSCGSRSCAASAKNALQKLVQGKGVVCATSGKSADGSASGTCQIDGVDVAGQIVRAGHVFSDTGLFATYASAEREARNQRLGIWRSGGERPAEHRAKVWAEAKQSAPEGCPIKGTVSGEAKVYVLPWSQNYEKVRVRTSRGERWFCDEAEARKAGFRPASDAS